MLKKRDVLFVLIMLISSVFAVSVSAASRYGDEREIVGSRGVVDCQEKLTPSGATQVWVSYMGQPHVFRESFCEDYNTIHYYSCRNPYPTKPVTKMCKLRCYKGACLDSFSDVLNKNSLYQRDKPAVDTRKKPTERIYYKPYKETYQRPIKIRNEDVADVQPTYAKFSTDFSCTETDADNQEARGVTTISSPSSVYYKDVKEDFCKDYFYKYEYSCNNKNPSVPSLVKCDLRCSAGACMNSFAKAVSTTSHLEER